MRSQASLLVNSCFAGGELAFFGAVRHKWCWHLSMRIVLIGLLAAAVVLAGVTSAAQFKVGVASRIVTPDPLLPVSGGVGPSHPANRKLGELSVRVLVLSEGTTKVAIVSADFLGFPAALGNRVRAAAPVIPADNILIAATHTHSAPDCYGFPDGKGGTDANPAYLASVCARMTEALNEAIARIEPASLKIATGEAKGRIAYNYYAEQLYDPRCSVIQALDSSGQPIATLVNYAVHPEVLGCDQGLCSPDLVGPLRDRITESGGGMGIFLNGALGGMVTADNRKPEGTEARNWAECERIGRLLADEALRIIQEAPVQAAPALFCAARPLKLPVESPLMRQLLKALPPTPGVSPSDDSVTTRLNLVNVGNAQILTIPGEALPNIGFYLKRKMRGQHNLLFGLTNDAFGYIMTREDFDSFKRYAYITRTSLGERAGTILVDEALRFVAESTAPAAFAVR